MVKPHGRLHSHLGLGYRGWVLLVLGGLASVSPGAATGQLPSYQAAPQQASLNIGIPTDPLLETDQPCIRAAVEDFPGDFFTQSERQQGGVVIHLLLLIYICCSLAIVCDKYFVPSLEIISNYFQVPTDVAGATFMAIGTSAPELYSSVIGAFVTEGDIGLGAIVGSAVFNLLFVTGVAELVVWKQDVPIDWYPISRDCIVYTIAVGALVIVIHNHTVTWEEALVMLLLFVMYVLILCFNTRIEGFCTIQAQKVKTKWTAFCKKLKMSEKPNETSPLVNHVVIPIVVEPPGDKIKEEDEKQDETKSKGQLAVARRSRRESQILTESVQVMTEEKKDETSLWTMPTHSVWRQIFWVVMWPAAFVFFLTVPDCRRHKSIKWMAITFILSVVWIGILSYLCVWMVTIIGYTLGMPDSVSGITILAAGTSMPEIIASIIVVRNGLGNMAICNLIGSNIFDILFCLGLPWLIKTLAFGTLVINSSGMTYTAIMLLSNIVLLYFIFMASRWKLNLMGGLANLFLYAVFITLACLYETNVFGPMSPPPCPV